MRQATETAIQSRKTPVQARSQATVEAIFEAALQVLLRDGLGKLTTTRVAERAGVSVGTLYQYYPNKQALLLGVLAEHLERVAQAVEAACLAVRGHAAGEAVARVVEAFLAAKLEDVAASSGLYAVATEMHGEAIVRRMTKRMRDALAALLRTLAEVEEERVETMVLMWSATMSGVSRVVLEGGVTPARVRMLRAELVRMCRGYVGGRA